MLLLLPLHSLLHRERVSGALHIAHTLLHKASKLRTID
jgi:hypothetical protein